MDGLLTADIAGLEKATYSLGSLAAGLGSIETGGALHGALVDSIIELSQDATLAVKAAAPYASGRLQQSVKASLFPNRKLAFLLKAGAKNKQGYNYGWFTELGTDEAANHAVDAIGYSHESGRAAPEHWTGIAAQHWFSGPVKLVLSDANRVVARNLANALDSLLSR